MYPIVFVGVLAICCSWPPNLPLRAAFELIVFFFFKLIVFFVLFVFFFDIFELFFFVIFEPKRDESGALTHGAQLVNCHKI